MLSTPSIPITLSASSSRSTRVIGQLNETWEKIQKEVATAKSQYEALCAAKQQNENDAIAFAESNTVYRANIQQLMQVLESKQQVLDNTKESSQELEAEVKRLKDEAMASRRQLEDLRKKEQVLEQDRDRAVAAKEQVQRQYDVLRESLVGLDSKCERQVAGLKHSLGSVHLQMKQMMEDTHVATEWLENEIQNHAAERAHSAQVLEEVHSKMNEADKVYVDEIQQELQQLLDNLTLHSSHNEDWKQAVEQCRGQVSGLVHRIREYSAEETQQKSHIATQVS
ncbi:hypothetical protein J3Q64DRAFT_1752933 [Phycomyces blakesleeanus]|uniref:SWI5-dependent HO expression protein 3 n=2 Tax=Phycomyces blakesleeanus TaxID=4837 RepID=A0A163AEX5_PHYB8|nr:hypothetical protein PHYBLDRAFT_181711 [Phycomyces blakesleeanus NRRL 1555(-)]OAD73001.1 hypothetical protein PHYBLDRAFT_181711 [Phycomyces blakesleeanus NRRL 1555(-)]|eukprot:XP_018291041.1 hypothetical protein PHYBLDRAFT_181711 [Phycomyces blakesleeanus NRRL 1555(-)]